METSQALRQNNTDPTQGVDSITRRIFEALVDPPPQDIKSVFQKYLQPVIRDWGIQSAWNILSRLEVAWDFRKPTLGLYDNALHFIGGAQKYGCTLAAALQDMYDVTLIANSDVSSEQLEEWYNLDLSRCRIKVISLPFFEKREAHHGIYDAGLVDPNMDNPFHAISRESGNYDVFVNNCMLEMVYPLAPVSEFMVHFPEREISRFFHVGEYTHIMFNSRYTAQWIEKRWQQTPDVHIFPPVDMTSPNLPEVKENIILSVSRFELSGNKQQREMIKAFIRLKQLHPDLARGWKLLLVGGSVAHNPYLDRIRRLVKSYPAHEIQIEVNVPASDLEKFYQRAKIFWHFSGLKQSDPAKMEHFGMTTVEAMQNGCVPVVFNGGGQTEIVEDGGSGVLFGSQESLLENTVRLMQDSQEMHRLSLGAYRRGKDFTKEVFDQKVREHFSAILKSYKFQ